MRTDAVAQPPNQDNIFAFQEESLDWKRSIRGFQLEMRFMLEPIGSPRYVKGREPGAQPVLVAIIDTSSFETPIP
ncbi:hypothetical protein Tco_0428801 [Tanacetum coccineum]